MRRVIAVTISVLLVAVVATTSIQADHRQPTDLADEWLDEHGDNITGALAWDNGELDGTVGSEGLFFDGRRVCVAHTEVPGCAAAGDITEVHAGFGLSGGADVGNASIAIDSSQTQQRVAESCGSSGAIQGILGNGSVECRKDIQTRVSEECGSLEAVRAINSNGSVDCVPRASGQCDSQEAVQAVNSDGSVDCIGVEPETLHYRTIPPTAIRPHKSGANEMCYKMTATGYETECAPRDHYAPVRLPDGATVQKITVYVEGSNIDASFMEHPLGSTSSGIIAFDSTGSSGEGAPLVMDNIGYTVDNANASLTMKFHADDTHKFIRDTLIEYVN